MTTKKTLAKPSAFDSRDRIGTGEQALEPLRRHGHEALADFCLALPETAARTQTGQHTAFSVRGKTFLYYLDDHHGDGRIAINCKTGHLQQADLVEADPQRYFLPPYMARHGWVGLWLDIGEIDWDAVEDLVVESYRLIAPRRLVAKISSRA